MRKFEVVDLEKLPKGARFYFVTDLHKKVYEVIEANSKNPYVVTIRLLGTNERIPAKTYHRENVADVEFQPKIKCVFLSLQQNGTKQ